MSEPPTRKPVPRAARKDTPAMLRRLTPAPGRRADVRTPLSVPLVLRSGKRRLSLETADVSLGGLFVVTGEDLPIRQLVRVEMMLPTDGRPFSATGWLVHRRPETGDAAGMGVQFYGLGKDEQARWDRFVERVRLGTPPVPAMVEMARLPRGEVVPRQFTRDASHSAVVRVQFPSSDELRVALLRDVPRGGIFLVCVLGLAVGDRVGLELVHPATGEVFEIEGRVRRRVQDDGVHGLDVKIALDDERRARFTEFVLDPLDPPDAIDDLP